MWDYKVLQPLWKGILDLISRLIEHVIPVDAKLCIFHILSGQFQLQFKEMKAKFL